MKMTMNPAAASVMFKASSNAGAPRASHVTKTAGVKFGESTTSKGVEVSVNDATIEKDPDAVMLRVGVHVTGRTRKEANTKLSRKALAVKKGFEELSSLQPEIKSTEFRVYEQYDHNQKPPKLLHYEGRAAYLVTVKNQAMEELPGIGARLINVATTKNANDVSAPSFTLSDFDAASDEAIDLAVKRAEALASQLAQSAGRTIGKVAHLKIMTQHHYGGGRQVMAMAQSARGGMPDGGVDEEVFELQPIQVSAPPIEARYDFED